MQVPERSLSRWLEILQALNPERMKLGLERINQVWQRMGKPSPGKTSVVVAGTNGKGSCIETMRCLAEQSGLRVACYTSPHLVHFRERIQLPEGRPSDEELVAAFVAVEEARGDIYLSWFEFTTLAAFTLLARVDVDLALLEIGLGGRLDAVNLIDGDLAIVTSIALDHCQWLGDNREAIAVEKAAVYRAGRPAVCGDQNPPRTLQQQLETIGAMPVLAERQYQVEVQADSWSFSSPTHSFKNLPLPALPLPPCAAALAAFLQLYPDTAASIVLKSLEQARLDGRMQWLRASRPELLLDIAHNPQAAQYLAEQLRLRDDATIHWVFGVCADKDVEQMLAPFTAHGGRWYAVAADSERALPAAELGALIERAGYTLHPVPGGAVDAGVRAALQQAKEQDLVVIFGSFYVVGEAMVGLQEKGKAA